VLIDNVHQQRNTVKETKIVYSQKGGGTAAERID
jgi:hypothetical protein